MKIHLRFFFLCNYTIIVFSGDFVSTYNIYSMIYMVYNLNYLIIIKGGTLK